MESEKKIYVTGVKKELRLFWKTLLLKSEYEESFSLGKCLFSNGFRTSTGFESTLKFWDLIVFIQTILILLASFLSDVPPSIVFNSEQFFPKLWNSCQLYGILFSYCHFYVRVQLVLYPFQSPFQQFSKLTLFFCRNL
jgi:hypothetical protein